MTIIAEDEHVERTSILDSDTVNIKGESDGPEDVKIDIDEYMSCGLIKNEDSDDLNQILLDDGCSKSAEQMNVEINDFQVLNQAIQSEVGSDGHKEETLVDVANTECDSISDKVETSDIKPEGFERDVLVTDNLESTEITCKDAPKSSKETPFFQCKFCEYKAKKKGTLVIHFKRKHDPHAEWFNCQSCGFKTKVKSELSTHIKYMHSQNFEWHLCPYCQFKSKHNKNVVKHLSKKHNPDAPCQKKPVCTVEWHHCQFCDFKTRQAYKLKHHTTVRHDGAPVWYQCHYCDFETKEKGYLLRHFRRVHVENVVWHQCQFCERKIKGKTNLALHVKYIHTQNTRWHHCQYCDYKTKYPENLMKHLKKRRDQNAPCEPVRRRKLD